MEEHKTYEFKIQGMDCLDCASSIEKAVVKIKGVKLVRLNFETAKLSVEVEADQDSQKIIQAMKGLGYGAQKLVSGETLTLHIEGMDCSDESEIIEKKLKALKGIGSFNILLVSQEVKIQYDPALVSATDIIKAIAETGMKASKVQKGKHKGATLWKNTQFVEQIIMLTGDNEGTAKAIAKELGIDEYKANLLPEDKVRMVRELKKKYKMIAMVGDGVNDAPAMAEANVGIAMGACGTDVCIETGDIALMADDLLKIPYVFSLSKRSVSNIKQNIFAAHLIIIILVPIALFGKIGLVPGLLINEVSGLIVIVNGLRLLKR